MEEIKKGLKDLNFNPNEIKVYLALTQLGEAPASKIAKKAELPRTTTISILGKLLEDNYFSSHHYKGVTYYWIESPKVIEEVFANKIAIAQRLSKHLSELYHTESFFPFAHVYDTKKSIKSFIEKLLITLRKDSTIYTIDAPRLGNYHKIFSDDFGAVMLGLKRKRNIMTKTLVPQGYFATINPIKLKLQEIVVKEMPKEIDFSASVWFVGKQLVLFSGGPPFAVAVEHKLIVQSCKSLFDYLWNISKAQN